MKRIRLVLKNRYLAWEEAYALVSQGKPLESLNLGDDAVCWC